MPAYPFVDSVPCTRNAITYNVICDTKCMYDITIATGLLSLADVATTTTCVLDDTDVCISQLSIRTYWCITHRYII